MYQAKSTVQMDTRNHGAGYQQQANSLSMNALNHLQGALSKVTNAAHQQAAEEKVEFNKQQLEKGLRDGTMGVSDDQYIADVMEGDDPYIKGRNEAQRKAVAANVTREFNERTATLSEEYKGQPEAMEAAFHGIKTAMSEELSLDNEGAFVLDSLHKSAIDRYIPQATRDGYVMNKQKEGAALMELTQQTTNTALNDIRNGDLSQIQKLTEVLTLELNEQVKRGFITVEQKNDYLYKAKLEAGEQGVKGQVDRLIEQGKYAQAQQVINQYTEGARNSGQFSPDDIDRVADGLHRDVEQKQSKARRVAKENYDIQLKQIEQESQVNWVQSAIDSGVPLPKGKESQKAVDIYYQSNPIDLTSEEGRVQFGKFMGDTGVIPTPMKSAMTRALLSENPAHAEMGVQIYTIAMQENPAAVAQAMDSKEQAVYANIATLIKHGMDTSEAIKRAKDTAYGRNQEEVKTLKSRAKSAEYKSTIQDAANEWLNKDTGFFGSNVSVTATGREAVAFQTAYESLYESNYIHTGGDHEQATALTNSQVAKKYSVSAINGERKVMLYAPEAAVGEWALEQWEHDKEQLLVDMPELAEANVQLQSDMKTGNDIHNKQAPSYSVTKDVTLDDGTTVKQLVYGKNGQPLRFRFDYKTSNNYNDMQETKRKKLEEAKRKQDIQQLIINNGEQHAIF